MNAVQMEFNIENKSATELQLEHMQKQIAAMDESMGKVRRKLFSEMTEVKKQYMVLKAENEELRNQLRELKNEKVEWDYEKEGCLFDVAERAAACG